MRADPDNRVTSRASETGAAGRGRGPTGLKAKPMGRSDIGLGVFALDRLRRGWEDGLRFGDGTLTTEK